MMENGEFEESAMESTKIGNISSFYYLNNKTCANFQRILSREPLSIIDCVKTLCDCPEYEELPVRHNEDKMNSEFAERCPLEIDLATQSFESPHTKAFLLFQAHMWRLPLPIMDYKTDLKSVLDQSIRIIQAMVDIAAEEAQLQTVLNLICILQCLHQAVHPWQSSLWTLPHMNPSTIAMFKSHSIECIPELIERRDMDSIIFGLGLPNPLSSKELLQHCRDLPVVRVRFELRVVPEGMDGDDEDSRKRRRMLTPLEPPYKIPPNADLELTVAVKYVNRP